MGMAADFILSFGTVWDPITAPSRLDAAPWWRTGELPGGAAAWAGGGGGGLSACR